MRLNDLQAKYEGVLLSAPMLAAALVDLIQDERADEREECARLADSVGTCYHNTAKWIASNIRQRNTEES